jgi:hypothetical protein
VVDLSGHGLPWFLGSWFILEGDVAMNAGLGVVIDEEKNTHVHKKMASTARDE